MLSFLKKIFGTKTVEPTPVPYKVETPAKIAEFPFPSVKAEKKPAEKKTADKKPAAKKTARKPKAPKA
jgi:hypothetical protein